MFVQQPLVLGEARCQGSDFHFRRCCKRGRVKRFLADLIQPLEQIFRLRPAARLVVAHHQLRIGQLTEILDVLVQKVLLIKLIE